MRLLLNRREFRVKRQDIKCVSRKKINSQVVNRGVRFMGMPRPVEIRAASEATKSESALLALHMANEGKETAKLVQQGRRIRLVQSASKNENGEYQTSIYSGWTASPDLVTTVTTRKDGTMLVSQRRMHGKRK